MRQLAVTVRTRTEGRWTGWSALDQERAVITGERPVASSTEQREGTEPSWVGESYGVQVRIELLSGKARRT